MPGPDPNALWCEKHDGKVTVTFERYFWTGNAGNRAKRANAIAQRMLFNDWYCRWCGDELPEWRRADAKYCCAGCKGRAARARMEQNAKWPKLAKP